MNSVILDESHRFFLCSKRGEGTKKLKNIKKIKEGKDQAIDLLNKEDKS